MAVNLQQEPFRDHLVADNALLYLPGGASLRQRKATFHLAPKGLSSRPRAASRSAGDHHKESSVSVANFLVIW